MKLFSDYLQSLENAVFSETNGKIKQTESRQLKTSAMLNLMKDFETLGIEVAKVQKGFIVRVPNKDNGSIVLGLDLQVKPLDYDFDTEKNAEIKRLAEINDRKAKAKKTAK